MNEDDYDDELPPISVNSPICDSKIFTMPSAKDVATERARELACEHELHLLRSCDAAAGEARSDSSGSEGEAALRAAVRDLWCPPPPEAPSPSLDALAGLLPTPAPDARFLQHYAHLFNSMPLDNLHQINQDIVSSLCLLLSEEREWREEEVVSCGAWLCVAAVSKRVAPARATRRALHVLLRDISTEQQRLSIGAAAYASVSAGVARLALCDAVRGAGPGGGALAALLASAALRALLQTEPGQAEWCERPLSVCELSALAAAHWRALAPRERYLALRLVGRLLAAAAPAADTAERAARDRLLATLAHHSPDANHHPEQLKVLVGASALQVLFRDRPDK